MKALARNILPFLCLLFLHLQQCTIIHALSLQTNSNVNQQTSTSISSSSTSDAVRKSWKVTDLEGLDSCKSSRAAISILEDACSKRQNSRFNSIFIPQGASEVNIRDGDLAVQTGIRGRPISDLIETNGNKEADRASLFLLCVFIASSISAVIVENNLPGPEIVRFVVVWILSFTPLAFVGAGLAVPDWLQGTLISIQRVILPSYRKRMIHHEAGHFLMGYLLGLPIKAYQSNSIKNAVEFYPFADPNYGTDKAKLLGFDSKVKFEDDYQYEESKPDIPFFSEGGRGDQLLERSVFRDPATKDRFATSKLPEKDKPKSVWPYRGFDPKLVDKFTVISLAGVCSEIISYGNAEGGFVDLSQLKQLFNNAEMELSEREIDNRIKFAISFGIAQLKLNLGVLDDLIKVMEAGGSVSQCCLAIEQSMNIPGGSVSEYECERKIQISKDIGLLERVLLNTSSKEYRKIINLEGDDPFYIAGALAFAFFVWASNGGLTL